jgi:hypothetical protein
LSLALLLCGIDPTLAQATNPSRYGNDNLRILPTPPTDRPPPDGWEGMSVDEADKVWNGGAKTIEILKKLKDAVDQYASLGECMRIDTAPGMPEVPSFCTAPVVVHESDGALIYALRQDEDCADCFNGSRLDFNKVRLDLEKLRIIYRCTKKMSDAAIKAGDTMSGVHGYSGIIWQGMRLEIEGSVRKLESAYDSKYAELIQKLRSAMIDMSICEARFGLEDWYDRFGFVYYEFMKDRYKRPD